MNQNRKKQQEQKGPRLQLRHAADLAYNLSHTELSFLSIRHCTVRVFELDHVTSATHHGRRLTARCPSEVVGLRVTITDWTGVDIDPLKLDVHG